MTDLDDYVHISIHKEDIKRQPKRVIKFIEEYADLEFYPGGLKSGKTFNKQKELNRLLKALTKQRKAEGDNESNIECIIYYQIFELFRRMMLSDLRKVNFNKLEK